MGHTGIVLNRNIQKLLFCLLASSDTWVFKVQSKYCEISLIVT